MSFDPSEHIGESVTLQGTARTAAAGAIVSVRGATMPVYIDGLKRWSQELEGRPVEVTGTLRLREPQVPREPADGFPAHGLPGRTFVLDGAKWEAT